MLTGLTIILCVCNLLQLRLIFSWSRVLNHIIIGEEVIGQQMGGKMRDKDRNTVKEKFSVSYI
jgi:hypothetical protein